MRIVAVPEFWCDKVAYREMAFPGVLRVALAANEHGRCIVKAKILMPVPVLLLEQPVTLAFVRCHAAQLAGTSGAVLM